MTPALTKAPESATPSGSALDAPSTGADLAHVDGSSVVFTDGQVNPDWVLSGAPRTRGVPLVSTRDGNASTNFWDCTAGKFEWHYAWDETVLILEGEVRITDASKTVTLRAGDVANFNAGSSYLWEVDKYVRKIAFHHRPAARSRISSLVRYSYRLPALMSVLALSVFRLVRR